MKSEQCVEVEDRERDAEGAEEILRMAAKVSSFREDSKAGAKESVAGRSHSFRTRRSLLEGKHNTEEPQSTRAPEQNPGAVSVRGPGFIRRIEEENESSTAVQSIVEDDVILERQGGLLVASVVDDDDEETTKKLREEIEEKDARLREMEQSLQTMRSSTHEVTTAIAAKPVTTKPQPHLTDAEQAALEFLLGDKSDMPDSEKSACCVIS